MLVRLAPLVVLWLSALAAWLLPGHLAPVDAATDGARVALLPPIWWLAAGVAVATVGGVWLRPRLAQVLPLALAAWLVVPWLPLPAPPVVSALVGPAATVAAAAIALAWMAGCCPAPSRVPVWCTDPRRAPLAAGLIAALLFGLAAWRTAPMRPGGDEPHYLVLTQSLLYDGNLKTENNYASGDYREYIDLRLEPHYLRRGQDGEIYSIHPPGLPALILPAFAVGGYPGVVVFLALFSAFGMALVWRIAWEVTESRAASWLAWATATLSAPVVLHTTTVYPDGPAAVLLLVGVWTLVRASPRGREGHGGGVGMAPWVAAGVALAILPWLHTRLAVLSIALGLCLVWQLLRGEGGMRHAAAAVASFVVVPMISAAGWFAYFWVIYGTPSPAAPYEGAGLHAVAHMPSGLGGLLFDHQFGLIPNAPIFLIALIGVGVMLGGRGWRQSPGRWLAAAVALLVVSYVVSISPMRMWWAGWSAPARFAVPVLPALAVAAAGAWQAARLGVTRAAMLLALGASAGITTLLVGVRQARLAYNVRDGWGLLLDWLSPLVALPYGMPSFHRLPEHHGFVDAAIWTAALLAAWLVLRRVDSRLRSRVALATAVPLLFVVAAMLATSLVWAASGEAAVRTAEAQLRLLRRVEPGARDVAVRFTPFRRLTPDELPSLLRIRTNERWLGGDDQLLFVLPGAVPAGTYRVHVSAVPSNGVRLAVGISRERFTIETWHVPAQGGDHVLTLDFPVDVRAIVIRGGVDAHAAIRDVALEPITISPDRRRGGRYAHWAVRYPGGTCYFVDPGAHVGGSGFWVRGGGAAEVVIVPRRRRDVVRLSLHNPPIDNRVTLRSGRWTLDVDLAPNEVRAVTIPIRSPGAITIGAAAGFRPADADGTSADRRSLGVRVELP